MAITLNIFDHWSHEARIFKCMQRQEAADVITGITYSQLTNAINKGGIPYIVWYGKVYIPEDAVNDIRQTWRHMHISYQELLPSYENTSLCAYFKDVRENDGEKYVVDNFNDIVHCHKQPRHRPRDEYIAKAA
jgi:hypothetical protein